MIQRIAWSPALLAVIVMLVALPVRGSFITPDGAQNLAGAANLLTSGTYSTFYSYRGRLDDPAGVLDELRADDRREPLMSLVLLPFMATAPAEWERDCLIHSDTPTCAAALRWTKLANVLLLGLLAILAAALARAVGVDRRWSWALGCAATLNTSLLPSVDDPRNTLLVAVLMTALAVAGLRALGPDGRRRHVVALGSIAGLLALSRTITMAVVVLCAVVVVAATRADRRVLLRLGAAAAIALLVVAPWVARNRIVVGEARIASGSHLVLAVRAEATSFTAPEYATSFLAYTPYVGPLLLQATVDQQHWERWLRNVGDESFFQLALGYVEGGEVPARAGPQASEADLRAAAVSLALERWPKSVALTAPYTYRGLWLEPEHGVLLRHDNPVVRGYGIVVGKATQAVHLLGLPLVLLGAYRTLRRRDVLLLAAILPAVASIAVHGALTHYIPRYSDPLVAFFYLLLLVQLRPSARTVSPDEAAAPPVPAA